MVRFAPLNVPLHRRAQTAAMCLVVFAPYILLGLFVAVCALFGPLWFVPALAYSAYLAYDWHAPRRGGHRPWLRTLSRPFFRVVSSYFPSQLVRWSEKEGSSSQLEETVKQFDSSQRYFFAVVPHGFIGIGVWCSFISDGNGFSRLFPGVRLRCLTLAMNFVLPFWRDYLLGLGMVDCSRASIRHAFARNLSLMVVPGGAREALYARPSDEVTLLIKRRKGFVKCALESGAHLVPCFGFGEQEAYDQVWNPEGSRLRAFQDFLLKKLTIAFPLVHGRGVFNYSFGWLPFRVPLTMVVGDPIQVEMTAHPTDEQIDKLHERFVSELIKLFENNKHKYGYGHQKLKFIE